MNLLVWDIKGWLFTGLAFFYAWSIIRTHIALDNFPIGAIQTTVPSYIMSILLLPSALLADSLCSPVAPCRYIFTFLKI